MTPFVKQGRLRALAVTNPKRLPALLDTPYAGRVRHQL
jgi:tripartite-type tricarboxylate transporter receptor subunit TctC